MLLNVFEFHNQELKDSEGTNYASYTIKRYGATLAHIKTFLNYKYKLNDIPLNRIRYLLSFELTLSTLDVSDAVIDGDIFNSTQDTKVSNSHLCNQLLLII